MIKECFQFFIEPAKNLKFHLKESRRRNRRERQERLTQSQLFIMELARELTWICQRSDILAHIWTGEDIWPPALCHQFIMETASILEMADHTEESLLMHTDLCVMNPNCGDHSVCVSDDDGNDLSDPKRLIMEWTRSQRRRHPIGESSGSPMPRKKNSSTHTHYQPELSLQATRLHGVWPGESVLMVLGDVELQWSRGHLPHLQPAMELLVWVALLTHLDKETIPRLWLVQKQKRHNNNALQYIPHTVWNWICQAAEDVTLDPDTAHPALLVSCDGKRLRCSVESRMVSHSWLRFDGWTCVLAAQGFSAGRHYWEVEVGGADWRLGVASESAMRRGFRPLDSAHGYLTLRLERGTQLLALTLPAARLASQPLPRCVGVYLDYEQGQLSFYDIQRRAHIYTYCERFTERMFPVFGTTDVTSEMVIRPASIRWSCLCKGPCLFC